jgi:SAM-dependent methyltransferase
MIRRILGRLYNSSPRELLRALRAALTPVPRLPGDARAEALARVLQEKFSVYQLDNLKKIDPEEFCRQIRSRLDVADAHGEGYADGELDRQRDLSIKFCWGHSHDFGGLRLEGRMGDRHIRLLANFATMFSVPLETFAGKDVLDVGCWTGGTSLLLAALGCRVHAIEEVKKYAETTAFLARSFGIDDRVAVEPISLYDCNSPAYYDRFDIAYFPGVIYHLSDPLVGLRILFNSLRIGGVILIESAGIDHEQPYCRFDGSLVHLSGTREELNRGGWNWFLPSPSALDRMLREAGFEKVETLWHTATRRVFGYAQKRSQSGICKAGLSTPNIR